MAHNTWYTLRPFGGSGFGQLGHGFAIPTPPLTHISPPLG